MKATTSITVRDQVLLDCLINTEWSLRSRNNFNFINYLDRYRTLGIVDSPAMCTIDDWNLSLEKWTEFAPIMFRSKRQYAQWTLMIHLLSSQRIIKGEFGFSRIIYRYTPRKTALEFTGGRSFGFKAYKHCVTINLPIVKLSNDLKKYISKVIEYIENRDSNKFVDSFDRKRKYYIFPRSSITPALDDFRNDKNINNLNNAVLNLKIPQKIINSFWGVFDPHGVLSKNDRYELSEMLIRAALLFFAVCRDIKRFLLLPARGFDTEERREECSGGYYLWCDKKSKYHPEALLPVMIAESLRGLRVSVGDWTEKHVKEIYQHASRAASVAILSRNFSHHIGSHVMPRSNVQDIEKRLAELFIITDEPPHKSQEIFPSIESLKTTLDDYIQKKAEFLAEVTTDPCSSSDTKLLGRDIIVPFMRNALLMDNIARNEGYGYKLRSLSKAEKGKLIKEDTGEYDKRITEVKSRMTSTLGITLFVCSDGKLPRILGPKLPSYDPYFWTSQNQRREPDLIGVDPQKADIDPLIAVPGMVGQFALYGILENIIRNAAKHDKNKEEGGNLSINMEIRDDPDAPLDYYTLRIWDSRTDPTNKSIYSHIPDDKKGEKRNRSLAEHLQCWANASLIDETGIVRRDAWGIAEIVICANLLAGRNRYDNFININNREKNVVSIYADKTLACSDKTIERSRSIASHKQTSKSSLLYELRLLKAKRVAFIGRIFADVWKKNRNEYDGKGIYVFKDIHELNCFLLRSEARQAFQFAVFDGESVPGDALDSDKVENISFLSALPFRLLYVPNDSVPFPKMTNKWVVFLSKAQLAEIIESSKPEEVIDCLWRQWLGANTPLNRSGRKVTAEVDLDVKADESPLKAWKPAIHEFNEKHESDLIEIRVRGVENPHKSAVQKSNEGIRTSFIRHKEFPGKLLKDDMFESFGKRSADCDVLLGAVIPDENKEYWELPYLLAEAGLSHILIIDERITERAMAPYNYDPRISGQLSIDLKNRTPCFWHLARKAKVYIATHLQVGDEKKSMKPLHMSYNDARKRFSYKRSKISCPALKIKINKNGLDVVCFDPIGAGGQYDPPEFQIVVIHQGIIDSFNPKSQRGDATIEENNIRKCIMKSHPWFVVESGRGIPPGLQKQSIRFLSFSVIDQALKADGIGKLMLTRRLMALPRFVVNGDF